MRLKRLYSKSKKSKPTPAEVPKVSTYKVDTTTLANGQIDLFDKAKGEWTGRN